MRNWRLIDEKVCRTQVYEIIDQLIEIIDRLQKARMKDKRLIDAVRIEIRTLS